MSEVLSQSQIDALLNAVHSGEKNLEPSQEQTEKKYRKYDFTTPRKFTKDHIKMLNGIFENIATIQASHNAANKNISLDVGISDLQLPLHPGAEKWWADHGFTK